STTDTTPHPRPDPPDSTGGSEDQVPAHRAAGKVRPRRGGRAQAGPDPSDRHLRLDDRATVRRRRATISLNSLPGMNQGRSRAGTTIGVAGLRGLRATRRFRRLRSNVPNPTSETRSPLDTASRMTLIAASIVRPISALLEPVRLAISAMRPFLFMRSALPPGR